MRRGTIVYMYKENKRKRKRRAERKGGCIIKFLLL